MYARGRGRGNYRGGWGSGRYGNTNNNNNLNWYETNKLKELLRTYDENKKQEEIMKNQNDMINAIAANFPQLNQAHLPNQMTQMNTTPQHLLNRTIQQQNKQQKEHQQQLQTDQISDSTLDLINKQQKLIDKLLSHQKNHVSQDTYQNNKRKRVTKAQDGQQEYGGKKNGNNIIEEGEILSDDDDDENDEALDFWKRTLKDYNYYHKKHKKDSIDYQNAIDLAFPTPTLLRKELAHRKLPRTIPHNKTFSIKALVLYYKDTLAMEIGDIKPYNHDDDDNNDDNE